MKLTQKDMPGLLEAARPLMEWIKAHGHPMVKVIVEDDRAEVVESYMCVTDNDLGAEATSDPGAAPTSEAPQPFEARLRPGCHGAPVAPLISKHRTLAAAVRKARQSDRWQVELASSADVLWTPPKRQSPLGYRLYGTGPQRGEPTLKECVAEAEKYLSSLTTKEN